MVGRAILLGGIHFAGGLAMTLQSTGHKTVISRQVQELPDPMFATLFDFHPRIATDTTPPLGTSVVRG